MQSKPPSEYTAIAESLGYEWLGPEVSKTDANTWWRCDKGHEFEMQYAGLRWRNNRCPYCSKAGRRKARDYHALAKASGFEWVGGEVVNTDTPTLWRCGNGHEFQMRYGDLRRGYGCKRCRVRSCDDYHEMAASLGYEWLGPMVRNVNTKTRWRCGAGHEFLTTYNILSSGSGCAACAGVARRSPDDYHHLALSRGYEWIGPEPKNVNTRTGWRCDKGHNFLSRYSAINRGRGCPVCKRSKGEQAVANCLDALGIAYQPQKRFRACRGIGGRMIPYDFYFKYKNKLFLVEYDGEHHTRPIDYFGGKSKFDDQVMNDRIKDKFARDYGYILIRVPHTVTDIGGFLVSSIASEVGVSYGEVLGSSHHRDLHIEPAPCSGGIGVQLPLIDFGKV